MNEVFQTMVTKSLARGDLAKHNREPHKNHGVVRTMLSEVGA
jgi:hypothetical protein